MGDETGGSNLPEALTFETFWAWLQTHPNCILRAGTPEVLLFDDEDYHWHFGVGEEGLLIVQVVRGKRLVGELVLRGTDVAYVQGGPGELEEEYLYELVSEGPDAMAVYHFVMTHPYEEESTTTPGRWTH